MHSEIVIYIPQENRAAHAQAFHRLLGVRVFMRGILTLADAGYNNFTLLAPNNQRRMIQKVMSRRLFRKKPGLRIRTIFTKHPYSCDTDAITELQRIQSDKVILLNSNLLFSKKAITSWIEVNTGKSDLWIGSGDYQHPHLLGAKGEIFQQELQKAKNSNATFAAIIRSIVANTTNQIKIPPDEPLFYISGEADVKKAERYLCEQIRLATTGYVAKYINKRISLPISRVLARLRVSPNTITVINMFIGLSAGIGSAGRTYTGLLLGAILFQTASIIDGCDGEVAKMTFRTSKFGQYIDTISDNFALVSFFVGLTIHQWRVTDDLYAFVWGGALLGGIGVLLAIMMTYLKHNTNSFSLVTYDKEFIQKLPASYPKALITFISYGKYLIKKDCFSFIFLLSAIFGILPMWLYATTATVWIGVFILVYLNIKPALTKGTVRDSWKNETR